MNTKVEVISISSRQKKTSSQFSPNLTTEQFNDVNPNIEKKSQSSNRNDS